MDGFNHEWQIKIEEFLMSSEEILEKTKQKHLVELETYHGELQKKIDTGWKKCAGHLNAEIMMRSIAKSQNYKEALHVQSLLEKSVFFFWLKGKDGTV